MGAAAEAALLSRRRLRMTCSLRGIRLDEDRAFRHAHRRYGSGLGAAFQVIAAALRQREVRENQDEEQDGQPAMQVASLH